MSVEKNEPQQPCCSKFKMFLFSMSFVYFAKAFQGSYMKSSVTQIERRFDIPSSLIGFIDGSFEIGNLLIITFVSYFGAKLHRPRLIGAGCLIMAVGSFLTALPHFFQGPYKYETTISHVSETNATETILPCIANGSHPHGDEPPTSESRAECEKAAGSSMWIYVFVGNMLRGIGETPVMPLGLSYLDDFAREENTAFYLSCIQTVGILGPVFGFMLGSFCAKLYVDFGAVDLDTITINHKDSRWVGAWWLGFLATGALMLLAGIPFWFLPRSFPKQGESPAKKGHDAQEDEQDTFIVAEGSKSPQSEKTVNATMSELTKDFLPSLKRLFSNSVYVLIVCAGVVQVSGFIGMITFKPKYMEQTYGQAPSKAIFLIGIINLPAVALGIITGGFVMKRFKLSVLGASKLCISTSILSFLLLLCQYFLHCGNMTVAGLTISYQGTFTALANVWVVYWCRIAAVATSCASEVSYQQESLLSQCNSVCSCSVRHWDPVCASNGLTYATPCLAGCRSSTGLGKEMVFHNCTCVQEANLPVTNMSAVLGQCSRENNCDTMFKIYMGVSVLGAFISACGATPGYVILLRSIDSELKSFAIGMQTLIVRTLGGIPPPIYFGALIDKTCLKWGIKRCGGRGACRLYDSNAFRTTFLGLIYGLYSISYLLFGLLYRRLAHRQRKLDLQNQGKATEQEANGVASNNSNRSSAIVTYKEDLDKETTI